MKIYSAMVGIGIFFSACSIHGIPDNAIQHDYNFYSDSQCKQETLKSYALNAPQKTNIGDSMIKVFDGGYRCSESKWTYSTRPFQAIVTHHQSSTDTGLRIDKVYPVDYEKDGVYYVKFYEICPSNFIYTTYYAKVDGNGNLSSTDIASPIYDDSCNIKNYFSPNKKYFERYPSFIETTTSCDKNDICSNSFFEMELIYGGISQNVINIDYRESKGGIARQPFYQHLTYDLSKSKIIRYKNMKIEVLHANNEEIKYKVLED